MVNNTEKKSYITKETFLPLSLVIVICAGVLWFNNTLNSIDVRLNNIEKLVVDQWTKKDMENWSLRLKLQNPEIEIPELTTD